MSSFDEAFDIYQSFLNTFEKNSKPEEYVKVDEESNRERAILKFLNGFNVELSNKRDGENNAQICCWWNNRDNTTEIFTLEELIEAFYSRS